MTVGELDETFQNLTEAERRKISEVLQRDLELQRQEGEKLLKLRQEIQFLRRKSAECIQQNSSLQKSSRLCGICGVTLGQLFNKGAQCSRCHQKVCVNCQTKIGSHWLCSLCQKNREYSAVTGEWFFKQNNCKQQLENDYTPTNNVTPSTASTSAKAPSTSEVSKILLKKLQNAEKRRQINAIITDDQLTNAFRRKPERKPEKVQSRTQDVLFRKKNKQTCATDSSEVETEGKQPAPDESRHSRFVEKWKGAALNRNSSGSKNVTPFSSEDSADAQVHSSNLHNIPLVTVESTDDDLQPKRSVVEKFREINHKLLRSPSVPTLKAQDLDRGIPRTGSLREGEDSKVTRKSTILSLVDMLTMKKHDSHGGSAVSSRINSPERAFASRLRSNRSSMASSHGSSTPDDIFLSESNSWDQNLTRASTLSITSLYSNLDPTGKYEIRGSVLVSLEYDCSAAVLKVHIQECENLAAADVRNNVSNPYVKVYLLPDRSTEGKRKTTVKRRTLNPKFEEILKYSGFGLKSELEQRVLLISVWHSHLLGRNDFLGEARIDLSDYPWGSNAYGFWYSLGPQQEDTRQSSIDEDFQGEMSLSIKYVPPDKSKDERRTGTFHCLVREARHLRSVRSSGSADPFLKAFMHPIHNKTKKQKSATLKNDLNPVWNHTFTFNGQTIEMLKQCSLEVSIFDHQHFGHNECMGYVRLNLGAGLCHKQPVDWMDAKDKEKSIWRTMIDRPNVWCDSRIALRPNPPQSKT